MAATGNLINHVTLPKSGGKRRFHSGVQRMSRKTASHANPLEHSGSHDEKVSRRAYHLWEADGRPHGRDREYWERAETLIGMEESGPTGQLPNPSANGAAIPPRQPVEEASIQENLGEFPGLSDENEGLQTPKARKPKATPQTEAPAVKKAAPKAKATPKEPAAAPAAKASAASPAPVKPKPAPKVKSEPAEPAAKPKKPKKPA